MMRCALLLLCAVMLAACQPANPPSTPLPTKEKTIDKVNADIDTAMKKAEAIRDIDDPMKKEY